MSRWIKLLASVLLAAWALAGCSMVTVEEMYTPPKRSPAYQDLQNSIDTAMEGMEYASPLSGENRQTVQSADLDGDGNEEYLLFARDTSENPMKILIFTRDDKGCRLVDMIESRGAAFDLVEYVDLDGNGGMELVVGRQVSNLILRSMSVYTFPEGKAQQLMSVNYSRIVPADLSGDGIPELMVITRGESDEDNAVATLYSFEDGAMVRSREASMSESSDHIKRIMVAKLHNGTNAVYVASSVADSNIITDVFALKGGRFTNVSFSNESGTSVQTLRNYYVYADDIDNDGVLELPDLIDMKSVENTWMASNQKLIRWYAMDLSGREVDKMYTFHNFDGGWYLQMDKFLIPRISVIQKDNSFVFYLWDEAFQTNEVLMTVYARSGPDRESVAASEGYYVLYETEGIIYTVKPEDLAMELGLIPELLAESFHPIQWDWKNGET